MRKVKNRLSVITIIILCLLGIFMGISYADDYKKCRGGGNEAQGNTIHLHKTGEEGVNKIEIGCDYELAMYAKEHPRQFMNSNLHKKVGNFITLHYGSASTIYKFKTATCMYHSQAGSKAGQYKIGTVMDIVGNKAKIYTKANKDGIEIKNDDIAKMAYCLSEANVPRDRWKNTFAAILQDSKEVKKYIDEDFLASETHYAVNPDCEKKAKAYADNQKNIAKPEKISTKNSPKPNKDGDDIYIGPFKINSGSYTPKEFKIKIDDNDATTRTTYYTKKDGTYIEHDLKDEEIGKNAFYLKVKKVNKNWKVELTLNYGNTISARIVLITEKAKGGQNLSISSAGTGAEFDLYDKKTLVWEGEVADEPELKIKKVDADDKTKVLPNVGFKIKHFSKGYVKQSGTKITYTDDENQATEFITDSKGLITIKGLSKGWYTVTETSNPYKEYEKNIGKRKNIYYDGGSGSTKTFIFENKKESETKVIVKKVGKKNDGTIETLSAVGFKLKSDKYAYVIQNSEDKIEYTTNIEEATTFFTEADGRTTIKNLPLGKYTFIETVNPYLNYSLSIGMEKDIEFKEADEEQVVENTEDLYGKLTIIKVGTKTDGSIELLPNVGFKLKHETLGYVQQYGSIISYTSDINYATEFFTGADTAGPEPLGMKEIENLKYGNYTFIETTNNNAGYEFNVGKTTTKLLNSSFDTLLVRNPLDGTGNLRILKKDEDSGTPLGGVHFKLYNKIFSGYVKKTGSGISYTSYWEEATNFITLAGTGIIEIEGLPAGDYILYETYNANPGYETYPNLRFNIMIEENSTTTWKYEEIGNIAQKGNLKIIKEDEEKKIPLANVSFTVKNNSNECYIRKNGDKIEYVNNESDATTFNTNELGEIEIEGLIVGNYTLHETYNGNKGYETYPVNKYFDATVKEDTGATVEWSESYVGNTPELGKVTVVKKLEDTDVLMGEIGFILENPEEGYVLEEDGEIEYVEDKEDATVFYTGTEGENKGKVTIEGLLLGKYNLYEVENNYYGFEINADEAIEVIQVTEGDNPPTPVDNKQKYIKLRGYVWEDDRTGKTHVPNDHYDDGESRKSDIIVRLKEGDTEIDTTVTNNNGEYEFTDVLVEKLKDYYIEFEYDGLTYTNVVADIKADNGSKAAESEKERKKLDEKFAKIEYGSEKDRGIHKDDRTYGVAKDSSDNPTLDLKYDYADNKAIIDKNRITESGEETDPIWGTISNPLLITANTNEASYSIQDKYDELSKTEIVDCIDNINLGIYEREQPDIALVKDIQNVRLAINGYNHIYEYAQRFINQEKYGDGYDVGVKFGNEYGKMKYTRPIYKSDYMWESVDKNKELEVYITYKIQIRNQSTNLKTRVNSIVDYYDSSYEEITGVGRTLSGNGTIGSPLTIDYNDGYGDGYNKMIINTSDVTITPQTTEDIYVQFKLNRQKVNDILNNKEALDNVAEINSYSTFYNEETERFYAGIDKNSAPGNAIPGNTDTYEDDTDTAPALQLTVQEGARKISGTVFLDKTEEGLLTAQIREGNGQYDTDGDTPIQGVKVKLVETSGTGKEYYIGENEGTGITTDPSNSKTNEDGNFTISGFIPGNYEIVYTWGRDLGGYTVQDYKGTVYDEERYNTINTKNDESGSLEGVGTSTSVYKWYKEESPRYTDAIDDYNTRIAIDEQLKTKTYSSDDNVEFNKTMDSTTQMMKIAVEYADEAFSSSDGSVKYKYEINNLDFGIVERARQSVELKKRVSAMKVTLANGQVVSDVTITEKGGVLEGSSKDHTTYMGPSSGNAGFAKIELDNELLQGSKVEVIYEFKFINQSEVDLINKTYYTFGSKSMKKTSDTDYELRKGTDTVGYAKESEVVKIKPTTVVDYLDRDWGYEASRNPNWTPITKEEFIEKYKNKGLTDEAVFGEGSAINNRIILITDTWNNEKATLVLPGREVTTTLEVSKLLNTTDDISLDNETEIIELTKGSKIPDKPVDPDDITPGGSNIIQRPGNYVPGEIPGGTPDGTPGGTPREPDTDIAETVIVTPSTGANLAFVIPITIAVIALVILGTGIVLIKKKVIDIKK